MDLDMDTGRREAHAIKVGAASALTPPPPQIGAESQQSGFANCSQARFARLRHTGIHDLASIGRVCAGTISWWTMIKC